MRQMMGGDISQYDRATQAEYLLERNQFDWAERELRASLEGSTPTNTIQF